MRNAKWQRMKQKLQEKEEAIATSALDSAKKKDALSDTNCESNDKVLTVLQPHAELPKGRQ
jgi:hypothetical protein